MPSINMIAPRRVEKRRLERAMRKLAIVVLIQLAFAAALGGWVFMKALTTRVTINELNAQLQYLAPKIRAVEALDKKTAELKPKVDLLNQAEERTMRWYDTLDKLTQSVPPSTWLTRVTTVANTGADPIFTINGLTCEQARVGETMMRLHSNPNFRSVDLHFTQKGTQSQIQAVEFEIGATMVSGNEKDNSKGVTPNGSGQS